ncbi:MAG: DUF2231 domain-containing protein [Aeromicrobium sp.]
MLDTIFGLPMHPLIVHATVVVVPLSAAIVALAALWPRFRAWAGYLPLAVSALAVLLVPLSTSSGEELEGRVAETQLIETHAGMAEGLLPWVVVLFVAALVMAFGRWRERSGKSESVSRSIVAAVIVAALIGSIGTLVQVGRIGHSGAKASWSEVDSAPKTSAESED